MAGLAPGDDVSQEEDDEQDADDDDDRLQEPPEQEADHRVTSLEPNVARWCSSCMSAASLCSGSERRPALPRRAGLVVTHLVENGDYLTKYQFSGVIDRSGFCGVAPLSLFEISDSEYATFGVHTTGSCLARYVS
jgi:hypothetical protein